MPQFLSIRLNISRVDKNWVVFGFSQTKAFAMIIVKKMSVFQLQVFFEMTQSESSDFLLKENLLRSFSGPLIF